MVNIRDNYLFRGTDQIGRITDSGVYEHSGKRLGYFRDSHVYDNVGRELAWLDGNRVKFPHDSETLRLEDVVAEISGGPHPDLARVAVKILLGG